MKRILIAITLVLSAGSAYAEDRPVDSASVVGHWVMRELKTEDADVRQSAAKTKFEFIFRADGTSLVRMSALDSKETASHTGTYRVADGQIFMKVEGRSNEEPVRAVIRDGALVILTPGQRVTEQVFAATKD